MSDSARDHWFGRLPDGRDVRRLTIGTAPGVVVEVLTLGAITHRVEVTCGDGERRTVVLGQDSIEDRLADKGFVGGTIGRYANRIADGVFDLEGREVVVGTNDRGHSLHGGPDGFDRRLWEPVSHTADSVVLAMTSPDGDQGFPGAVTSRVTYAVQDDTVAIELEAVTDATTVVNLTNHTYFNLDGDGSGTVAEHVLEVTSEEYTPVDDGGIPLGEHAAVSGTPFDFRRPSPVGAALASVHEQLDAVGGGIDHNYVIVGSGLRLAATLESPRTRTRLELHTDQPGLQVYTGNTLDSPARPSSVDRYRTHSGLALEPQLFPDSPHHPEWPSATLRPGQTYRSRLEWRFGIR